MNTRKIFPLVLGLLASLLVVSFAVAQTGGDFDLTWWTVDGGGGALSGGGYALGGTIGQPEPGPVLTGGDFSLYNGFWAAGGAALPGCPNPITGGWIMGPDSGYTGVNYDFTAGPDATATSPFTYTWSSDGLVSGQSTANATYNWTVTGVHTISVTIENCGGNVNITHSITLAELPPACAVPLTGVGLSGPASGQTDADLTFTASYTPANATLPVTYTWSSDGLLSGQGTDTAVYRWSSAGGKTVQVTARNCGGQDYSASQAVTITAACAAPLVDVSITGQSSGYTGLTYQFTALPDPNTATPPISYVWSNDGLVGGQGTAQASYTWPISGSHAISLTATNCGGAVNADHTINLTDPPPGCDFPLTDFAIDGPTTGQTGQNLTFTSHITPTNATTPITYTWSSAGLVSGQGSDTAVYNWATPGQYQIVASASNCGGESTDLLQIVIASEYHIYLPLVVKGEQP